MKQFTALLLATMLLVTLSACGQPSSDRTVAVTADEALTIALEQAGVTQDSVRNLENTLELDDGVLVYEIDFDAGNQEYSFDVNAQTGEIVERDRERNG